MIPTSSIREALSDRALLGSVLEGPSWEAWRTLLIASVGETLTDSERPIFQQLTQREHEPGQRVEELVVVAGRRGGKSRAISVLATYLAGLCRHPSLVRGETGILLCIAQDQKQADIVLDYIEANFRQSPILRQLIEQRTQRALRLINRITIEVRASDFRTLRGPTYIAIVADEIAFWMTTESSANPDDEVLNAIRPGLATTRGPLFLISSPYARKGELWSLFQRHFGRQGDPLILVAQGSSRTFNATLPQSLVDRAYERDPLSASAEYGGEFRKDLESFMTPQAVLACVPSGLFERPPQSGLRYWAFTDPAGGSGQDSMTLAIAHREADQVFLDCLREARPLFSPEQVTAEFSAVCKAYRINKVTGDRYGGEWPREQFRKQGINYELAPKPKSDLYRDVLPLLNSRRVELLDQRRLIAQLIGLERRTARSGCDTIDHGVHAHDDLANAVAGAVFCSQQGRRELVMGIATGPDLVGPIVRVDPDTFEPLDEQKPTRIRVVKLTEQEAPAVRGVQGALYQ